MDLWTAILGMIAAYSLGWITREDQELARSNRRPKTSQVIRRSA